MFVRILEFIKQLTKPFYYLAYLFSSSKPIPSSGNEILHTSATVLADKIRNKKLTSEEVVLTFIERCKEVNPIVNAIIEDRFDDALNDAKLVDEFIQTTAMTAVQIKADKPLLGIPITVKETCAVKGMKLTAGILAYKDNRATYDGDAVHLMIQAGAIPIAVTSTPLYNSWIETKNPIIGYTKNPYDQGKAIGGSSGGEAALISCGASILGIGSDTGGSIRLPAAFAGIFGHKPSARMVPVKGHLHFSTNEDLVGMVTVGPICRYAIDLELAMNVLSEKKLHRNALILTVDVSQLNVFYVQEFEDKSYAVNDSIKRKLMDVVKYMKEGCGCKAEQLNIDEFERIPDMGLAFLDRAIDIVVEEYCEKNPVRFEKLIKLLSIYTRRILFGHDMNIYSKLKNSLQLKLTNLLAENGVLLLPTFPTSAFHKYQSYWVFHGMAYSNFVNIIGFPSTAVPIGFDEQNMPISIQVIAGPNQDRLCLAVAKELESFSGGWVPPYLQSDS